MAREPALGAVRERRNQRNHTVDHSLKPRSRRDGRNGWCCPHHWSKSQEEHPDWWDDGEYVGPYRD